MDEEIKQEEVPVVDAAQPPVSDEEFLAFMLANLTNGILGLYKCGFKGVEVLQQISFCELRARDIWDRRDTYDDKLGPAVSPASEVKQLFTPHPSLGYKDGDKVISGGMPYVCKDGVMKLDLP